MVQPPMTFSLITPAYNAEQTIGRMIDSVLKQSYQDFEFLIIDDGSNDGTLSTIQAYQDKDPRVHAFSIPNAGPGGARNHGIDHARGDYIIFLDSDDQVRPDFLKKYVEILTQNPALDLIVTGYNTLVYDDDDLVSKRQTTYPEKLLTNHQDFLNELYPLMAGQMMYVVWNKLYRCDVIKLNKVRFPEHSRSCEDRIFNIRYANHVHQCQVIEEPHFDYSFDGKNSLTNKYFPDKFETFLVFYRELLTLVNGDYRGYASLFLKGVMSCFIALHTKSCPLTKKEKLDFISHVLNHNVVYKSATIAKADSTMKKVIIQLFKTQSTQLNYQASKAMLVVSNQSPKLIEKFKASY